MGKSWQDATNLFIGHVSGPLHVSRLAAAVSNPDIITTYKNAQHDFIVTT